MPRPELIQKALAGIPEPDQDATIAKRVIHGYIGDLEDRLALLETEVAATKRRFASQLNDWASRITLGLPPPPPSTE